MAYIDSLGNGIAPYTLGIAPVVSLSGKSATSATPVVLVGLSTRQVATMIVTTSAGVSAGSVQLQISNDGTNWLNAGSAVTTSAASTSTQVNVSSAYGRYARAAIVTTITGGTITATVGLYG
jgi:hypothetical protein